MAVRECCIYYACPCTEIVDAVAPTLPVTHRERFLVSGRSLSLVPSSVMHVNPENLQEALNLHIWYVILR